jgi:hypothetical protein
MPTRKIGSDRVVRSTAFTVSIGSSPHVWYVTRAAKIRLRLRSTTNDQTSASCCHRKVKALRHWQFPYQPKWPRASDNLQNFPRTETAKSPWSLRECIFPAGMNNAGYNITAWSLVLTHSCNADNESP